MAFSNALKTYLEQIAILPLLGDTETECFAKLREGDESMRKFIIEANLRLVVKIANEFPRINETYREDIIQAGNRGLMQAVDHFDHTRGIKFSSFARYYILHEIRKELVVLHGCGIINPGTANNLSLRIKKYKEEVNPRPTVKELCNALGFKESVVRALFNGWHFQSLNEKIEGDNREKIEFFEDSQKSPEEILLEEGMVEQVVALCERILSPSEKDMLFRFYGFRTERKKLREIALLYPPYTASRIQQIVQEAVLKLRSAIATSK